MPLGLNRTDLNSTGISFKNGDPVNTSTISFGTAVTLPKDFGNVVTIPVSEGNAVTLPKNFGNQV